jgi:hypothetical protein
MNRRTWAPASIGVALLALAGCATTTGPAAPGALAPAGAPVAAVEPPRLPPAVNEN